MIPGDGQWREVSGQPPFLVVGRAPEGFGDCYVEYMVGFTIVGRQEAFAYDRVVIRTDWPMTRVRVIQSGGAPCLAIGMDVAPSDGYGVYVDVAARFVEECRRMRSYPPDYFTDGMTYHSAWFEDSAFGTWRQACGRYA